MSDGSAGDSKHRRERGFALLIVLWSVTLLAGLTMRLTATGRSEVRIASNVREAAIAGAQADDLAFAAIVRVMAATPEQRGVDRIDHTVPLAGGTAAIKVSSLAGRVNPNVAPESVIAMLIQHVGVSPSRAASLAAAIADWRTPGDTPRPGGAKAPQYRAAGLSYSPPGAPFESIGELGLVLGMSRAILQRLAPHMTVLYPGDPVASAADPIVLQVLRELDLVDPHASPEGTDSEVDYVDIVVRVSRTSGAVFTREATAIVGHGLAKGRYKVIEWEAGSQAQ